MRSSSRATAASIGAEVAPAMNQSPVESPAGRGSALPPDAWRREAVIVIDANARVVEWNAAAGLMFGIGREEAIGRSVGTMIIPDANRDGHRANWAALHAADAPAEWSFEALTLLARGEEVPVGVRVTRIGAEAPHFILSVRDMSGR